MNELIVDSEWRTDQFPFHEYLSYADSRFVLCEVVTADGLTMEAVCTRTYPSARQPDFWFETWTTKDPRCTDKENGVLSEEQEVVRWKRIGKIVKTHEHNRGLNVAVRVFSDDELPVDAGDSCAEVIMDLLSIDSRVSLRNPDINRKIPIKITPILNK